MAYIKPIPGICDRCGLRYPLKDLQFEYELGKNTGLRTCRYCNDPEHPQLDTRGLRTDDKQSVKDSRSDTPTLSTERAMSAWNPVGVQLTSNIYVKSGTVTVKTT